MTRPRTRFDRRRTGLAGLVALGLLAPAIPAAGGADRPAPPPPLEELQVDGPTGAATSSDRAEPLTTVGPGGRAVVSESVSSPVAPGVELTRFEHLDPRGWVHGQVLQVDLTEDATRSDLLWPGTVSATAPLSEMAADQGAIAGVNGDFFDINRTGAPLGAAIAGGELLKGPVPGRGLSAGVTTKGLGVLTDVLLVGTVSLDGATRPLDGLNQSALPSGGVGAFTPTWGTGDRRRAVEGATRVHEVVVIDDRVVASGPDVLDVPVPEDGLVLTGREDGADALAGVTTGDPVSIDHRPSTAAELAFAVGGNIVLVEDGQVPHGLDDAVTAPRTAVGFSEDGREMLLVAVDGRSSVSRGATIHELGELLVSLGAHRALNLDGGGSTTLLAREPGHQPSIQGRPSDGVERPVPNGVGLFTAPGSGTVTGLSVAATPDDPTAHRVFPGLQRTFSAAAYDETFAPVESGAVRWSSRPANLGRFAPDGVFHASTPGDGDARARVPGADGTTRLHVLGELTRIAAEPGRINLPDADAEASFHVTGFDDDGYRAIVEPPDVTLGVDDGLVEVEATDTGAFTVTATDTGATLVTIEVGDHQVHLPVTVGTETIPVADLETTDGWTAAHARAPGVSIGSVPARTGDGIELSYDFTQHTATRAAYLTATPRLALPGQPLRFGLWAKGDGNGAWLRMNVVDAGATTHVLDLGYLDDTEWRYFEADIPDGVTMPLELWRIYAVEIDPDAQYAGSVVLDDLSVEVAPDIEVPTLARVEDPLVVTDGTLEEDRWTFAVINDSEFVGTNVNHRLARDAMRQAVAAEPDLVIINGDLTDTATPADVADARALIDAELEGHVPWYYVPGNHETYGPGDLRYWTAEFGDTTKTFDHRGVRFILLNTALGTLRASEFAQIAWLRSLLEDAATDEDVDQVVVVGHHPTRDPNPQDASRLADDQEIALLEGWLTRFRERSGGKGIAYLAGHAHVTRWEHVDGVPYAVLPPAGAKIYGPQDDGGFTGWTLFGVDPDAPRVAPQARHHAAPDSRARAARWLRAEVRPQLEDIDLDAPAALAVGEHAGVTATGVLTQGRRFPLRYPATVRWSGDDIHVGSIEDARQAGAIAAFDPRTWTVTGLRPGDGTLRIETNVYAAEVPLRVTGG